MSTIDKPRPTLRNMLEGEEFKQQLQRALPRHLSPERFIRVAITAMTRTPKLAECEPISFFKCLLDLSSLGLEPDGRRAHLIPFNNNRRGVVECQSIVDYKGFIELAKRSGDVSVWRPETVCENDEFEWLNGEVTHRIDWRKDRGKVQAVYSAVKMQDGSVDYDVMTREEVEAIRKRSRSGNDGPWVTDWAEMAKKTVIRRHSKRLTLSPELHEAIMADIEREMKPATGQVVASAMVPGFLAPPTATPALQPPSPINEAAAFTDPQPFAEPEPAAAPEPQEAQADKPARKRAATAPKPEAPTLELSGDPPTKAELIASRLQAAGVTWDQAEIVLLENAIIEQPTPLAKLQPDVMAQVETMLNEIIEMASREQSPSL